MTTLTAILGAEDLRPFLGKVDLSALGFPLKAFKENPLQAIRSNVFEKGVLRLREKLFCLFLRSRASVSMQAYVFRKLDLYVLAF